MDNNEGVVLIEQIVKEAGAYPTLEVTGNFITTGVKLGRLLYSSRDRIALQEYKIDNPEELETIPPIFFKDVTSIKHVKEMELIHKFNSLLDQMSYTRSLVKGIAEMAKNI
jgi:hypothetical protein